MQNIFLLLLAFWSVATFAQVPIGSWRDHFSYRKAQCVAFGDDKVYASASNGLFWYQPSTGLTQTVSTVNGLSDVGISAITYSDTHKVLVVGYENGNIDLMFEKKVVNLPYILQKQMQGSKRINHIYINQQNDIYVSTGFGIVVLNVEKLEVKDTYYIGNGGENLWVYATIEFENKIYAATENGMFFAQADNPALYHYDSWSYIQDLPTINTEYTSLAVCNNKLFAVQSTGATTPDIIWFYDGNTWESSPAPFQQVRSLNASHNTLLVASREGAHLYSDFPNSYIVVQPFGSDYKFYPNSAVVSSSGSIAIADNQLGLIYGAENSWTRVSPNSPGEDRAYYVLPTPTDLFVLAGARTDTWGNRFYPLTFHKLENNSWSTVNNFDFFDAVRITQSPAYSNEYFVSSWGHGVVVYRDGQVVENYTPENSSLQTILPGAYCRIGGVAFDDDGNMWVSNAGVPNPISVKLTDGTWKSFPYEGQIGSQRLSDIIHSPSGQLWVIVPSGGGLFVLDPGENPGLADSHKTRKVTMVAPDGESLPSDVNCLAFDRDGYLWVGTTEGVLVSYNPSRVMEPAEFAIQRARIPDELEGFAAYLLESQTITSIAVDGGNRKWFGTQRSGVYLQSANGDSQILHFTTDNSPLPSNSIQHIGIHPTTGEVFFATDKGLVSYRADATEPESRFGKVYAFPNPVRPEFNGNITITGLVENTNVKITDIAGNLVFETTSKGGQATWDGKNLRGQKVATGVYLYFCADSKGEEATVGKILFIK